MSDHEVDTLTTIRNDLREILPQMKFLAESVKPRGARLMLDRLASEIGGLEWYANHTLENKPEE